MSLSVAEQERILQTVHQSLVAFIYDDLSGIPEIRERLHAEGLRLNIGLEAGLENDSSPAKELLASLGVSASNGKEDNLDGWRDMGIALDDLREVAQTEMRRNDEAIQMMIGQIREISFSLSPRGRNYSWGWLRLHYPELGLEQNPTTIQDQRFALLSDSGYWENLVETVLRSISTRPDVKQVLSALLKTVTFAQANT